MLNELLFIVGLVSAFGAVLVLYRVWSVEGLFVWIAIATVLANIQVLKTVELFGLTSTLGNGLYASVFLATDILSERHGKVVARRGVALGFVALVAMVLFVNVAILFAPAESDIAHGHLQALFGLLPRIAIAGAVAFGVSQLHDVFVFAWWRRLLPARRFLWIRNNASTLVSQLIDTAIFVSIAFIGVYPADVVLDILLTTYLFKAIPAVLDTPVLYLATRRSTSRPQIAAEGERIAR